MQNKNNDPKAKTLEELVVEIKSVVKVNKGGRQRRFSATVVVGDRKGKVGLGMGKANEVPDAIKKAIQAANKLILNVIVKNMDITGYNYYGIIYVPDSSTYQNTIVEYNNITYIGPQICFHPFGLTRFIDSNITIQESYATGNEVAECNKVEMGGIQLYFTNQLLIYLFGLEIQIQV